MATDRTRVDKWLWAVRVFPTRTAATAAVDGGHVRINGARAKPASPVQPGDRVAATVGDHERVVEVVSVIERRVGAPAAATCYVDHSPPPPPREERVPPMFVRDERRDGRPSANVASSTGSAGGAEARARDGPAPNPIGAMPGRRADQRAARSIS